MTNLEENLDNAIKAIEKNKLSCDREFFKLYPFTTENISGYINEFSLKNKKLLTVGSSLDQSINALLKGCTDQTIYDISPFTRYHFYLKKSAIEVLTYEEFCLFFCYEKYITLYYEDIKIAKKLLENKKIFNMKSYEKILYRLRADDYESYLFWDEIFKNYEGQEIRKGLFYDDENRFDIIKMMSPYLKNRNMYNKTKKLIGYLNPKFINENIYDLKLNEKYDNVFLSNIACYQPSMIAYKEFIDGLKEYMNENARLLMAYLYDTTIDSEYNKRWQEIYDLKNVLKLFEEYHLEMSSFIGVRGLLFESEETKDSVFIYTKKK